ncbi:alpha/beta hydrolase [Microbacterium sp.]|uniref:alpha/beta fold hydrolase n=1 Tax=Microbacterium sp. TaxID=51671 RepID=UPI0026106094|nr:alpha/beta hydrolase [Microbacterium sp.]MCV0334721.1 alpha/beta hydrolase [Microbacterium sp.]MCV0374100.1 alpha/beta hydrolase [Microbacterium sp.]MCV0391310.1 alpha/beta hydrolase [Microbacterium sp.]MCV0418706.1 alpha/beta hydrolase [Microbacterium sp.]MCV0423151.1 alpha/beta hydrolase [Microbacterium sp.]
MPSVPALLARSIHTAAAVSPRIAGDIAYRLFFTTTPRMAVREADAPTHADARRGGITVRGIDVATYEWGAGARTLLLLHGWRGRASQFAPLVRELVAEGLRVIAFDAPAHGASPGRGTDIRDWIDAAEQLQTDHGPFDAIIGHSFGALAALTIARSTVPTPAVVAIAGAASPDAFVARFADDLRLDDATTARLSERFRRRLGMDRSEVSARYDAARHPLPAGTALLVVHDRDDRRMPDHDSLRLHDAHGDRSRLVRTEGLGHTRVLSADATLDAVVALVAGAYPLTASKDSEGDVGWIGGGFPGKSVDRRSARRTAPR